MVASALAAQDQRVHYHRQANEGLAAARNAGLALGRGTYVQFLDADDLIAPSKLSRQVRLMEIDPYLGVSYSNFGASTALPAGALTARRGGLARSPSKTSYSLGNVG